jgi:hypothetical protein
MNTFISKSKNDPGQQLEWLENLLMEMESNGEIAIIAAHVPVSKYDCGYSWSVRYRALMVRF